MEISRACCNSRKRKIYSTIVYGYGKMNSIDFHQILKWFVIVLVAGFIGQFGKYFATYLIERARKKKMNNAARKAADTIYQARDSASQGDFPEAARANSKAEKKALKALMKMDKKGK